MRTLKSALLPFAIVALLAGAGIAAVLFTASLLDRPGSSFAGDETGVRPAAVAGRFYPGDPAKLRRAVSMFMEHARPPATPQPLAIVTPHAGYIYSGQIAADAFAQARGHDYDVIVILGTNHTTPGFRGVSVFGGAGYLTPLGIAEIDREVAETLIARDAAFRFQPDVHEREHSVEVQVPFVQQIFPGTKIVAAVVGEPDVELCRRFGRALAGALAGRRALIVASSDLSHYPGYEDAVVADRRTLAAIAALDEQAFHDGAKRQLELGLPGLSTCACGEGPIMAAMVAAKAMGARRGVVVSCANSGDSSVGSPDRVVGYGAVAFVEGEPGADTTALDQTLELRAAANLADAQSPLSAEERTRLLAFARATIQSYLESEVTPLARDFPPDLVRRQGAFVTLRKAHALRGCIGHMAEDEPLCQVVGAMALQAAFNDRRFPPLSAGELEQVEIEISVLTPRRPVAGADDIVVGRDGVVLEKGGRSAVFLPHVATEQGWDRDTMLTRLSRKAGLPDDAWRSGAAFFTFQAEVFDEAAIDGEPGRSEGRSEAR